MPLRWPQEIHNDELSANPHLRARAAQSTHCSPAFCSFSYVAKGKFFAKQSHLIPAHPNWVNAPKGLRRCGRLRSMPIADCCRKGAAMFPRPSAREREVGLVDRPSPGMRKPICLTVAHARPIGVFRVSETPDPETSLSR